MKKEIIKKLEEYHKEQGVIFLSQEDAISYFRGLVEIIESFAEKPKTEQYQCQSYVEGSEVIDCACGKCF